MLRRIVVGQHRGHQARQQQGIAPLGGYVDADPEHAAIPDPVVPQFSRGGIAWTGSARNLADFMGH
jgi:hypothetical protein